MTELNAFPGDKIASIEEYESGQNTYDNGDMVMAAAVGKIILDNNTRIATIKHPNPSSFPQVGDVVIGRVMAVMSSMIAVMVEYINGKPTSSQVECICSTRNIRKKNIALVNDVVALKIISHLNGTLHASIDEPHLGVLLTKCRKCGGSVVPMRDAIKCVECSWIDERKLSANFDNSDFVRLRD